MSPATQRLDDLYRRAPLRKLKRMRRVLGEFIATIDEICPTAGEDIEGHAGTVSDSIRDVMSAAANLDGWIHGRSRRT